MIQNCSSSSDEGKDDDAEDDDREDGGLENVEEEDEQTTVVGSLASFRDKKTNDINDDEVANCKLRPSFIMSTGY